MHIFLRMTIIAGSLFCLSGCDKIDARVNEKIETKVNEKVDAYKTEMEERLKKIEFSQEISDITIKNISESEATISTDGSGYNIARTEKGIFFVTGRSVEPYLDGYKVMFDVGNPSNVRFSGMEITIKWHKPLGQVPFAEYSSSLKQKTIQVTKDFPPGSYTAVETTLTPAKPDEVKIIDITLKPNQISLRKSQ